MKDKISIPARNIFLAAPVAMLSLGVYDILKGRSVSRVLLNYAVAGTMFGAGCLYQLNALCSGKGTYHGELNFESENGTTQWKLSAVDDKRCCFDFKYSLDSESLNSVVKEKPAFLNALTQMTLKGVQAVKNALDIHSPSAAWFRTEENSKED